MASRIKKSGWLALYIITGTIDLIQIIADLTLTEFVGAPEIGSEIADPFIGLILLGYFQLKGVSIITKPSRLISLLGVTGLEELTGGLAPAWILDVWYIHKTVRREEAAAAAAREQEEAFQNQDRVPLYSEVDGVPTRLPKSDTNTAPERALNAFDGIRPPRGGLVAGD